MYTWFYVAITVLQLVIHAGASEKSVLKVPYRPGYDREGNIEFSDYRQDEPTGDLRTDLMSLHKDDRELTCNGCRTVVKMIAVKAKQALKKNPTRDGLANAYSSICKFKGFMRKNYEYKLQRDMQKKDETGE